MNTLVLDYGSKIIKYRINSKEFMCINNSNDVDSFIELLIDRYNLCTTEELLVVLAIKPSEYIDISKRLLNVDKQTIDGKHYKYKIQLFPSLVAISIENMDSLPDVYGILDIGYESVRYAMFKSGKINRNTIIEVDYGIKMLYLDVLDMLKREHDLEASEDGMYSLLMNCSDSKIGNIFENYKFKYIETLKNKLIERNSAFTMMDNYVFGYSSEILREQVNIDENLKYTSNSLYDIVRGIDKIVHLI